MTDVINDIVEMFDKFGNQRYGEEVSLRDHMLQTALLAEQNATSKSLIAAALLHDIGHFIIDNEENMDGVHEQIGADYLSQYFNEEVTGPIRFHVRAKRYICANNPDYLKDLSSASKISLQQQGGPLSEYDKISFENHVHFVGSVRLRLWDEKAKVPGLKTPDLEHFIPYLKIGLIK